MTKKFGGFNIFSYLCTRKGKGMKKEELSKRIQNMHRLEEMAKAPSSSFDVYANSSKDELLNVISYLYKMLEDKDGQIEELKNDAKENKAMLSTLLDKISKMEASQSKQPDYLSIIEKLNKQIADLTTINRQQLCQINDLIASNNNHTRNRFGKKSERNRNNDGNGATPSTVGRDEQEEAYNGTPESLPEESHSEMAEETTVGKDVRSYENRKGLKYKTMDGRGVLHECDMTKLPAGAIIISTDIKFVMEQVSYMEKHMYQMVTYKTSPDAKPQTVYIPMEGEQEMIQNVPGTHASVNLLANLAVDKYQISTPLHREIMRMLNNEMQCCENTLRNWLEKGGKYLRKILPFLRGKLLSDMSVVNCDETWTLVRVASKYKKKYLWCLVNKAEKIVYFLYDNGSRGRQVLRDFLGDKKIKAMMSDAYNVYSFIGKEIQAEHLCCMDHARRRFYAAMVSAKDPDAALIVQWLDELYMKEKEYRSFHLSPGEIRERRNEEETESIVKKIRRRLDELIARGLDNLSQYMYDAVTYMNNWWKELFNYRNDGAYPISNALAERSIRSLTAERNASMFFSSQGGAELSAVYHTFVETCKMNGVSVLEYFRSVFHAMADGREDYENLTPMAMATNLK